MDLAKYIFFAQLWVLICSLEQICQKRSQPETIKSFNFSNLSQIKNTIKPFTTYGSIDLANKQIDLIPSFVFANFCFVQINLAGNNIANISSDSFSGILLVNQLILKRNRIESVNGLFSGLKGQTIRTLDISFNQIRNFSQPECVEIIEKLDLSSNLIEFIADRAFSCFKTLQKITLASNRIKIITSGMLSGLDRLWILELSTNLIETIEPDAFSSLERLQDLRLAKNKLKRLPEACFRGLSSLSNLYLDSNELVSISDGVFDTVGDFYILSLARNKLNSSISFKAIETVTNVYLDYNEIPFVGKDFFKGLELVAFISLSQSKVEIIEPYAFADNAYLNTLFLIYNRISRLERDVFEGLSSLAELSINNNIISVIDDHVFRPLFSISFMSISHNLLKSIQTNLFSDLSQLSSLDISSNIISSIEPAAFRNLSKLDELLLSKNELSQLAEGSFQHLPRLKTLDLSQNKFKIIRSFFFSGLSSLQTLNLAGNGINTIESYSFRDLTNIKLIDLSDNFVISIDAFAFSGPSNELFSVQLTHNRIDQIDSVMFLGSSVKQISYAFNNVESLGDGALMNLDQAEQLDLSFNRLRFISTILFGSTSMVRALLLGHNRISHLGFLKGKQFLNLVELDVSSNLIETARASDFEHLGLLRALNIGYNRLKNLDSSLFYRSGLTWLNLSNVFCPLEIQMDEFVSLDLSLNSNLTLKLPSSKVWNTTIRLNLKLSSVNLSSLDLSGFLALQEIDLSGNPDDGRFRLEGLKNLRRISLAQMGLETIERFNFVQFDFLYRLNLSFNRIEAVGEGLFGKSLFYLDLSNNFISFVGLNAFSGLDIKEVNLENNRIVSFQPMGSLSAVQNFNLKRNNLRILNGFMAERSIFLDLFLLDLSDNSLRTLELSSMMADFNNFKRLLIERNQIEAIDQSSFLRMEDLQELSLASNCIDSVDFSSFANLEGLERLSLSNNSITRLDERTFANLLQLKYLNLSSNRLESIGSRLFASLYNLETLDLSSNLLRAIEDLTFSRMSFLQDVYLNRNADEMKFSVNSFGGLESLVNLYLSTKVIECERNHEILWSSLKPQQEKSVNEVVYFKTINILVESEAVDCGLSLKFIKRNIQLNLKTDYHLLVFLRNCLKYDLLLNS